MSTGPTVKAITSRDNQLMVRLRKLATDSNAYRKLGDLWIEGDHLCSAFVQRQRRAPQAVITEEAWELPKFKALAQTADAVAVISSGLMAEISGLESPSPLGFVLPWNAASELKPGEPTVVLDRLQDAGNVGAIIRSAAAFGFMQVVALKGTAALWSPKVLRAGMGAHFGLDLVEMVEEVSLLALGLPLLATSSHATKALHQVELPWPCAWVMGHEGQGVSPNVLRHCELTLRIPQPGGEESLNVAAATAVCLYESARQRG